MAVALGSLPEAVAAYDAAMRLSEKRAQDDPANTQWQRDLSVSHDKIGDVLVAQGDGPGALAAYRKGLAIGEVGMWTTSLPHTYPQILLKSHKLRTQNL